MAPYADDDLPAHPKRETFRHIIINVACGYPLKQYKSDMYPHEWNEQVC
jgi:hypothetical protein